MCELGQSKTISTTLHIAWTANFMLRQNESKAILGKYSNDPRVRWRHKRREMMAIAGTILSAKWLAKIKWRSDVGCRLRKRAREQHGASTGNLQEETYGHINSDFCDGMATTVCCFILLSRLPTTSSGDICVPACKLHKHQRVSSGLSHLIRRL